MIVLDTHIWIWWVQDDPRLTPDQRRAIAESEPSGVGVPAIACWEVAKAMQLRRLLLPLAAREWIRTALAYPGIELLPLSAEIAIDSAALPGEFHKDPADQLIVATARILDQPLLTADAKILAYPHVPLVRA